MKRNRIISIILTLMLLGTALLALPVGAQAATVSEVVDFYNVAIEQTFNTYPHLRVTCAIQNRSALRGTNSLLTVGIALFGYMRQIDASLDYMAKTVEQMAEIPLGGLVYNSPIPGLDAEDVTTASATDLGGGGKALNITAKRMTDEFQAGLSVLLEEAEAEVKAAVDADPNGSVDFVRLTILEYKIYLEIDAECNITTAKLSVKFNLKLNNLAGTVQLFGTQRGDVEFDFDLAIDFKVTPRFSNGIYAQYGPETGLEGKPFYAMPISPFNFDLIDPSYSSIEGCAWNMQFSLNAQPAPGTFVTLYIPLPSGYSVDGLKLYHEKLGGVYKEISPSGTAIINGKDYVKFETDSFGSFAMASLEILPIDDAVLLYNAAIDKAFTTYPRLDVTCAIQNRSTPRGTNPLLTVGVALFGYMKHIDATLDDMAETIEQMAAELFGDIVYGVPKPRVAAGDVTFAKITNLGGGKKSIDITTKRVADDVEAIIAELKLEAENFAYDLINADPAAKVDNVVLNVVEHRINVILDAAGNITAASSATKFSLKLNGLTALNIPLFGSVKGDVEFDFDLAIDFKVTPRFSNGIYAQYGPETGLCGIPLIVTPISPFNFDLSDFLLIPVPGYAWNIRFGETEPYAQPAPGTFVTLSFTVPDGHSADKLRLFHLKADGGEEILQPSGTKTINGIEYVQFEVSSFSPFMLTSVDEGNAGGGFTTWLMRLLEWIMHYLFFGWLWR